MCAQECNRTFGRHNATRSSNFRQQTRPEVQTCTWRWRSVHAGQLGRHRRGGDRRQPPAIIRRPLALPAAAAAIAAGRPPPNGHRMHHLWEGSRTSYQSVICCQAVEPCAGPTAFYCSTV